MKKNNKSTEAKPVKLSREKEKTRPGRKVDSLRIIHELQERVDKLEMRNKELAGTEKVLRVREEQLRLISENLTGTALFVLVRDNNGRMYYEYVGSSMERITGVTTEEALKDLTKIRDIIQPEYHLPLAKAISESRDNLTRLEMEVCLRHAQTGKNRWALIRSTPYRRLDGFTYWYGVLVDITERKKTEEALRESEDRFRFSLKNSPVSVAAQDRSLRFLWAYNQRTIDPNYVVGKTDLDLFPPETAERLTALKREVLQTEKETREQLWMDSGGKRVFLDLTLSPLRDTYGSVVGVGIAAVDLTQSKLAEDALHESEEKYRFMVEYMIDVVWQVSPDLRFTYVSPAVERQSGYAPDEVSGHSIFDFMTPVSAAHVKALIAARHAQQQDGVILEPMRYEIEQVRKNGQHIWVEVISHPLFDAEGRLLGFQGLTHDITERKRMETALRESEAKNRAIVEAIPDLMFIQNRAGVYIDCHAADYRLMAAPPELVLGHTTREVIPSELADEFQPKFDLAFQTGEVQTHEYILNVPNGSRYFESRMIAYNDDRLLSIVRDITARKQAEQKLMDMEKLQSILLNAPELTSIVLLDCAGSILTLNEIVAQHIGMRPNEVLGYLIHDFYPKEFADTRKERLEESIRTAAVVRFEDSRQGFWFENSFYPILDEAGQVVRVAVYTHDITERKQKEELLRASEQRYRALAEASPDMIFVVDRDDHFTYVNNHISKQFEMEPCALIGQPRSSLFGASDLDKTRKSLQQVFETGDSLYSEMEIAFPHGALSLGIWLVPLRDQGGRVEQILGVSRDITELKKMESSLKEINQQLESRVEKRTAELLDNRNHLRRLTQQIVTTQEEERRRISRELHDEAGQTLIGLRFSLDTVYRDLPVDLDNLRRRMLKALALTDQTLKRIRTLAYNLRPPALELLGINLVIKELCQEFSDQTRIEVEYSGVDLEGVQDEISISLYRFVQEALTNVAKHARAKKVRVAFECENNLIKVSVQDNGRGIPTGNAGSGIGLVGIKERFDTLGGTMEIKPLIPHGTQIQVCVPWEDI